MYIYKKETNLPNLEGVAQKMLLPCPWPLKILKGEAGAFFEPSPPNLANLFLFCRCTNDITITSGYIWLFQSWKKWKSFPLQLFRASWIDWWYKIHNLCLIIMNPSQNDHFLTSKFCQSFMKIDQKMQILCYQLIFRRVYFFLFTL